MFRMGRVICNLSKTSWTAHQVSSTSNIFSWSRQRCLSRLTCASTRISRRLLSTEAQSTPPNSAASAVDERPPRYLFQSVINLFDRYGATALLFHTVTAGVSLLICWLLVRSPNVDVPGLLAQAGILSPLTLLIAKTTESFGTGAFAVAYILHKATGPLRLLLTLAITPALVRRYGPRPAIKIVQNSSKL